MDLEIKTDSVDLDQSMYYMQMSLPQQTPFDMNRYQYQQNYPGASKFKISKYTHKQDDTKICKIRA